MPDECYKYNFIYTYIQVKVRWNSPLLYLTVKWIVYDFPMVVCLKMMNLYKIIIRWALADSHGQREQTNKQSIFVQLYQELQGTRNKYQCFAKTHLIFTERFLKRRWEGYRDKSGGGGEADVIYHAGISFIPQLLVPDSFIRWSAGPNAASRPAVLYCLPVTYILPDDVSKYQVLLSSAVNKFHD